MNTRLWRGALALLASMSVAAAPNFSGVWETIVPPRVLRTAEGRLPPLLPAARILYEQHLALRRQHDLRFDNTLRCQPPGIPRIYLEGMPFEIQQQDDFVYVLFQWNRLFRVIELNIDHAQQNIYGPTFLGFAVGHWDGDALSIDTTGFNDTTLLDQTGLPHSEELHVTERWQLAKNGSYIESLITVEDSKMYTAPWEFKLRFRKLPAGAEIHEDVCLERLKVAPPDGAAAARDR